MSLNLNGRFGAFFAAVLGITVSGTLSQYTLAQTMVPNLPSTDFDYYSYAVTNLPAHYTGSNGVSFADNTPPDNQISNAGATLGRVLFYDKRLSHDTSIACASCHQQEAGFSDPAPLSTGVGGQTARHSMGLSNAKFYENGRFFWDERAATLEDQVLMPIRSPVEMGMTLPALNTRLTNTDFYGELFEAAFGTPEVSSERISKALAQFVRSMVSYESKFDSIIDANGDPDLGQLTASELRGFQIYNSHEGRCGQCHGTAGHISDDVHNIGLDEIDTDLGAGDGRFKSPSMRNVEVRSGGFMHDGRFSTLEEVIEFYSTGVQQGNPNLDAVLQDFVPDFSAEDAQGLLDFLKSLTDWNFLSDPKFSDPFVFACDFNVNGACEIDDLNLLLAEGPVASGVPVDDTNARFDLNGDGIIDVQDRDVWLSEAALTDGLGSPYLLADANLDGVVDVSDFNAWNVGKFSSTTDWDAGDFNGDGVVDVSDFNLWNVNKFTSSVTTVPEPTTAVAFLWLAGLLVAGKYLDNRSRSSRSA